MFILDSHLDTPSKLLAGRDIGLDNPDAHVDFPKLRRGGVCQINFYPVFLSAGYDEEKDLNRPGIDAVVDHIDHAVQVAGLNFFRVLPDVAQTKML